MKPTQPRMFQTEDLPLFSQTAPRVQVAEYQPEPASGQARLPGMTVTTLPCGCRPGYFLCPTAQRLWNEYIRQSYMTAEEWRESQRRLGAYRRHIGDTVCACCGGMHDTEDCPRLEE